MSEAEQTTDADTDVFADDLEDDVWAEEPAGPGILSRMFAEVAGTFILVFMGLAAFTFITSGANGPLTIAIVFAVGATLAIAIFGGISGAHINPAVTVGLWMAGRFPGRDVVLYIIGQVLGGLAAGAATTALVASLPQVTDASGAMVQAAVGYGERSMMGFGLGAAFIVEVLLAAILVAVVLAVTSHRSLASAATAPLTIGLAFGFLLLVALPITNGSLNPARATGAALFADSLALEQLWVFWGASIIGAAITGLLFRAFGPEEDLIILQQTETVETIEVIED